MQESNSLLQFHADALDLVSDAVIAIDNQHHVIYLNQAATAQYDVERSEAIAQPLESLYEYRWVNPEDELEAFHALASTGVWKGENIHIKRNAEQIWVESTVSLLKDEQNKQIGLLAVIRDITERKQAQAQALQLSEEKFSKAFRCSPDAIIINTLSDGRILEVNDSFLDLFSYRREEVIGHTSLELNLTHSEDRDRYLQLLHQQGSIRNLEINVYSKAGEVRVVLFSAEPIEIGGESCILCVLHDITERKQAEEALRQSEERFRQFVENSRDVFWMWDAIEDRKLYISPTYERVWGQSCQSVYTNPALFLDTVHPEDKERVRVALETLTQTENLDIEYRIVQPSGQVRWIHDRAFPVRNQLGEVYRFVGIAKDITERKHAEVQIKTSLQEKEILLQEIHHRVKNNLQVISSLLDLQSMQIQDQHTLEMFRESQNRIRSMALIHEKLYGLQSLIKVNFAEYIHSLTSYLLQVYAISPNNVILQINVDDVLLTINTAIPCGLIINELVSNALKYGFSHQEAGSIWIALYQEDNYFNLVVSNNGSQLQAPVDLAHTETLGLQLVSTLVQQINGHIEVEQNQRLTFKIQFHELGS